MGSTTKKMMVLVAKVGIDPTAFPLLGERSIQLSYSATSRYGAMFEEDSLLLWSVQTLFQGHVSANLLEGRRSFERVCEFCLALEKPVSLVCKQPGQAT